MLRAWEPGQSPGGSGGDDTSCHRGRNRCHHGARAWMRPVREPLIAAHSFRVPSGREIWVKTARKGVLPGHTHPAQARGKHLWKRLCTERAPRAPQAVAAPLFPTREALEAPTCCQEDTECTSPSPRGAPLSLFPSSPTLPSPSSGDPVPEGRRLRKKKGING